MATRSEQLTSVATALGSTAAWPTAGDGEPVFAEPWEGRAFAMALELVERGELTWDDFRVRLIAAIAADPHRPYYESWVIAVEQLALDTAAVTRDDIEIARSRAAAYRFDDDVLGDVEVFPLDVATTDLADLLDTVSNGPGGSSLSAATIDRAQLRTCGHAELYRTWAGGAPSSWGLRLFDRDDAPMLDLALPSPFQVSGVADWSRLDCWNVLRARFLGLGPDPVDRRGRSGRA
ncbi:MAG: nitrile hydratase accessory protein [Ilumatobacteraceae bacterium]